MTLAALASIPELELRAGAARDRLARADDAVIAELDTLVASIARGNAEDGYLACALVLARDPALAARLHALAISRGASWAALVLADAPASRGLLLGARLPDALAHAETVRVAPDSRMPWDHFRFRQRVQRYVVAHPSPLVAQRLLASPTALLIDVVRVASRRPTTPELLRVVATSARWIARLEVRDALVKNPFAPTGVALLYLPTVRRTTWTELAGVSRVHPLVREASRALLRAPR